MIYFWMEFDQHYFYENEKRPRRCLPSSSHYICGIFFYRLAPTKFSSDQQLLNTKRCNKIYRDHFLSFRDLPGHAGRGKISQNRKYYRNDETFLIAATGGNVSIYTEPNVSWNDFGVFRTHLLFWKLVAYYSATDSYYYFAGIRDKKRRKISGKKIWWRVWELSGKSTKVGVEGKLRVRS